MLKFKKAIALFTSTIMMVSLMAGCSGSSKNANNSSSNTANATASASKWTYTKGGPASEKPVDVTILTHSGHASTLAIPNNNLPVYDAIQKRLGININWQILDSNTYNDTVSVRLMSKDLPDMVVLKELTQAHKLIGDKFFYAYDDLNYKENAPYAQELLKKSDYAHLEKIYRSIYDDKKIYSFGNTVLPRLLYRNWIVNIKWLEKLGIKEPTTADEFLNMLRAFRDKDPNGNGKKDEIPLVNTGSWHTLGELFNLNFEFGWSLDSKGKIQYEYTTENYKEYLKFRKQLFDENLIDKEKRDMTANYELVAQDRTGVFEYFGTFQNTISSYSPYYNKTEKNPVFREIMPLVNKYTGKQQKFSRLSTGTGEGMYILKVAKNPEVCLRIADFLWASDEYEMFRYFGIEGMSYKKEADGKYSNIVPADYKGTLTYLVSIGGGQPPFANRQSELGWRNTYPTWMFDGAAKLQKYYVDPLTPFVFNTQESDEIKNYKTDVETYRDEMTANFIEGRTSLDKYDDYVKQMNKIGLTQLTSIYQKKYEQTSK